VPQPRRIYKPQDVERLHKALEPFVDIPSLRRLAADGREIREALKTDIPPQVIHALMYAAKEMFRPIHREQIKTPKDAAAIFMALLGHLDQEEFHTMALNTKNRVLGIHCVYRGNVNSAMIRVGEVFKEALKQNAVSILVAHNHPSGTADPSTEDTLVTRQIVEAGKLLDIEVLDSLVVTKSSFVSLRERGIGFS
jgi:DNA repair protein RadC